MTTRTRRLRWIVLAGAIAGGSWLLGLDGLHSVRAQGAPTVRGQIALDRANAKTHSRQGIALARQAIATLQAASTPEEILRADGINTRSYLEWNGVRQSVQRMMGWGGAEPDPILRQVIPLIDKARELSSIAHTRMATAAQTETGRAENIAQALQNIETAIQYAEVADSYVF